MQCYTSLECSDVFGCHQATLQKSSWPPELSVAGMWPSCMFAFGNASHICFILLKMRLNVVVECQKDFVIHTSAKGWNINGIPIVISTMLWCIFYHERPLLDKVGCLFLAIPPDTPEIFDSSAGAVIGATKALANLTVVTVEFTPVAIISTGSIQYLSFSFCQFIIRQTL